MSNMYNEIDTSREQTDEKSAHTAAAPKKMPTFLLGSGLALLLTTAAFFSGLHIGSEQTETIASEANLFSVFSSRADKDVDLKEFWRVWELMDKKLPTSAKVTD